MQSKTYNTGRKAQREKINLWDSFVNHLESIYFSGAAELLDSQTIAFEYQAFKDCYSTGV